MKQVIVSKHISWNDIERPEAEELATVVRELDLLPVDAEFIVRGKSRPEITVRPHYTSILLQVPVFNKKTRITRGVSVFLLVKDQQLITLHFQPVIVLQQIIQAFQENPEKQADGFGDSAMNLALYIINELYLASFHKLRRLSKHIDIAEDAVFAGNERKMVEEIAILTRDVMDFRKIIRPQRQLFTPDPPTTLDEESQAQWQRLDGQTKKLWEMLEGIFESVTQLASTNDSLLQQKLNSLLRMLSFYSILSIPAFLVTGVFTPQINHSSPVTSVIFWSTFILFVVALVGIFLKFRKNRVL